jgi:allophanate hydrolase subunit 2
VCSLEVIAPGLTRLTDLGRAATHLGLSANGALDERAARCANALVGNEANAPLAESLGPGLEFTVDCHAIVAITGADCDVLVDGQSARTWTTLHLRPAQRVQVSRIRRGLRVYVAFHGSLGAQVRLGSVAPDPVLDLDTRLAVGQRCTLPRLAPRTMPWGGPLLNLSAPARRFGQTAVTTTPGPDRDLFGATMERLHRSEFVMSPQSNAMGVRLHGRAPVAQDRGELLSAAVPVGAVEIPSRELVIVLHRGRGVTAGYPVAAVVTRDGLDRLAQTCPGEIVRFRPTNVSVAREEYLRMLARLRAVHARAREIIDRQFAVSEIG